MKTETISVRVDEFTKKASEEILKMHGISLSTAVNLFLRQVIFTGKIPFKLKVPKYIMDNDLTIDELNVLYKKKLECDENSIDFSLDNELKLLKEKQKNFTSFVIQKLK